MYLTPGDTATVLAGGPENLSPENLAAIRAAYHLDQPFLVQYAYWLGDVLQGDLGRSYVYRQNVTDLLVSRADVTLLLVVMAATIVLTVSILLGVVSAVRGGWFDRATLSATTFLSGIPPFVGAVALVAAFAVGWEIFPSTGEGSGAVDRVYHLTLPAVALAIGSLAGLTRVTRQAMVENERADHVEAAIARGLPWRYVVRVHVLRNALLPIITMSGLVVAGMFAGTVIVEEAFGLSGVGSLLVAAIDDRDFPVTQAMLLLLVVAYVITTRIADLLQRLADPRLRKA
jgi:peptide/nickel transport system permease protein